MNITSSNPISFGRKIPLSEYKGPILKLTAKDKKQIEDLLQKKAGYELELATINDILKHNTKTITRENKRLSTAEMRLLGFISEIDRLIKEIKVNRLNKQKAKLDKKSSATIIDLPK